MMHTKWKYLFIGLILMLGFSSCTSVEPSSSSEPDIAGLNSQGDDFTGADDGDIGDELGDADDFGDGGSDFADDSGSAEDSGVDDGLGSDEFSDSEFSDASLESADAGQENFGAEDGGLGADPLGDEDPFADATAEPQDISAEPLPLESEVETAGFGGGGSVEIMDIKYLANKAGGTVVVDTSSPSEFRTRINEETNQFVVEISNATLPKRLKRPYIMKEFEGEFAAVNAYQSPGSSTARVVVQMRNPGKALVQREGNSLLILPPTPQNVAAFVDDADPDEIVDESAGKESEDQEPSYNVAEAEKDEKSLGARTLDEFLTGNNKFYGRKLSIQTKDADVRDALNFIAEYSGVNMIISDDVGGTISLKLREVPWDQALITIMRAKRLGYIRQGNVIRISTLGTLQSESDSARAILESQRSLIPIRVRVIPVSYANVADLSKQLGPFLSDGRGKIAFDNRTSSLIITDTDEVINRVARLVKNLDVPPMQVMIEGKIVEATEEFQRSVGVNWNFDGETVNLSPGGGANGGPLDLRTNLNINPVSRESLGGNPFALSLSVGRLDFLGELGAILSLAETETMVKILSSPRIVTLNKESAQITQEGQVLTKATITDQSGTSKTTIERTPVTLNLTVTPQITAAGSVILDVNVKRQFASGVVDSETLARAVNTREAKTKVLVDNGQTAVIGGVYQSDASQGESGVPFLKDIPVVGWLFKSRQRDYQKNELLIFLTPRIINFGEQGRENDEGETSS